MPSMGCGRDHEILKAQRQHYIAKGVMDGTHKMENLISRKMGRR